MQTQVKYLKKNWEELADNQDYLMQNLSYTNLIVKASATTPTTQDGAIIIGYGNVLTNSILQGKIWGKAQENEVQISLSKEI